MKLREIKNDGPSFQGITVNSWHVRKMRRKRRGSKWKAVEIHLIIYVCICCIDVDKILYDNLAAFNVFLVRCRDLTKTCDDLVCELQSYLVQIMAKPLQPPFQLMASGHERALR